MAKGNKENLAAEVHGRRERRGRIASKLEKISWLPRGLRKGKVLTIRRQLAEGSYDINKRLSAVLDKIHKILIK
jgi:hypothetical protein